MHKDLSQHQFDGVGARDEFNRKPIAEKIIKLLTSDIDLSPMIIDGDWGTGKSEFCHKLINKFRAEHKDAQILYIDAFQADHADNPMMTILAEIMTLVSADKKEAFLEKAIPVARYVIKTGLKALVSHVLRINAEDIPAGIEQNIKDASNKAIDASVEAILKDHEQAEQNLKSLQILLATLAKEQPMIIFIDELDRCRPDFSVQMLEVIKHTFNVENVKFILVTNSNQLKAAINHAYGASIDATRYLDKFIKFTIKLPEKVISQSYDPKLASIEYFDQLVQNSSILNTTQLNASGTSVFHFTHKLIQTKKLSLREVETFIRHLEIANILNIKMDKSKIFGYILLDILAIFIDCFEPQLKINIYQQNIDATDLLSLIDLKNSKDLPISGTTAIIIWLASGASINQENSLNRIQELDEDNKYNPLEQQLFEWRYRGISYFDPIIKTIDTLHLR